MPVIVAFEYACPEDYRVSLTNIELGREVLITLKTPKECTEGQGISQCERTICSLYLNDKICKWYEKRDNQDRRRERDIEAARARRAMQRYRMSEFRALTLITPFEVDWTLKKDAKGTQSGTLRLHDEHPS